MAELITTERLKELAAQLRENEHSLVLIPPDQIASALEELVALRKILGSSNYLLLNANDVWDWASAECCQMDIEEGLPILLEMQQRWGGEGILAFMAEGEGLEPQKPLLRQIDMAKYSEALEFVRGKETGVFRSGGSSGSRNNL